MPFTKPEPVDRVDRGSLQRMNRVDPALLEAFERELTPDVARRLLELATRRTAMLRAAGVTVASDEAKLLVQEALTETLSRAERWDPGEATLAAHLSGVVRRRSWAKLSQARKLRALAIEVVTGGKSRDGAAAQAEAPSEPAALQPIWREGARELAQRILAGLSEKGAEDAAVRLILEAYCDGAATRAQVLAASGLTVEEYAGARRRLDRLLAGMPMPALESPVSALWRMR
jgi:hypothetical protein